MSPTTRLVGSLPIAAHLGDTEHLCVYATRCRPRNDDYGRVAILALVCEGHLIDILAATLCETVGTIGVGWIDRIEPADHRYAVELREFLSTKFGPFECGQAID